MLSSMASMDLCFRLHGLHGHSKPRSSWDLLLLYTQMEWKVAL